MGCDIHMYAEYRKKGRTDDDWRSDTGRINPGRMYGLFGTLAKGVRSTHEDSIEPKGRAAQMSYTTKYDDRLYLVDKADDDESNVTRDRAKEWIEKGYVEVVDEHWITDPDHHSHTWLTMDEYRKCLENFNRRAVEAGYTSVGNEGYWGVLSYMSEFETRGFDTRLVIWFDN